MTLLTPSTAAPTRPSWLGVDVPEVARLRAELLPGDRSRVFAASITAPDRADQLLPLASPGSGAMCWSWPRAF